MRFFIGRIINQPTGFNKPPPPFLRHNVINLCFTFNEHTLGIITHKHLEIATSVQM